MQCDMDSARIMSPGSLSGLSPHFIYNITWLRLVLENPHWLKDVADRPISQSRISGKDTSGSVESFKPCRIEHLDNNMQIGSSERWLPLNVFDFIDGIDPNIIISNEEPSEKQEEENCNTYPYHTSFCLRLIEFWQDLLHVTSIPESMHDLIASRSNNLTEY